MTQRHPHFAKFDGLLNGLINLVSVAEQRQAFMVNHEDLLEALKCESVILMALEILLRKRRGHKKGQTLYRFGLFRSSVRGSCLPLTHALIQIFHA